MSSKTMFSNSILMIGIFLIFFNTFGMIVNILYEITVLLLSLSWSFIKLIPNTFLSYPLTIFCITLVLIFNKNLLKTIKNKSLSQFFVSNLVASGFQCAVCSQELVDMVIQQCGHSFHKQCVRKYIETKVECPTCGVKTKELRSESIGERANLIVLLMRKRSRITIGILLFLVFCVVVYCHKQRIWPDRVQQEVRG